MVSKVYLTLKIAIICTVRNADDKLKRELLTYTQDLESKGHNVHLPFRDTPQTLSGLEICCINRNGIIEADEIHVFYNPDSQGTHFDMGMAFALRKKIEIISNIKYGKGKSFPRMLDEWKKTKEIE